MEKIFPTSSYQNGENPKEKVDLGLISRVRHVKTQSHVVDLRTIFFDSILVTESNGTFDNWNLGHIDHL